MQKKKLKARICLILTLITVFIGVSGLQASLKTLIRGTSVWDAEYNFVGGTHSGSDFFWRQVSKTERYLVPQKGVQAKVIKDMEYENIDFYYIQSQELSSESISGSDNLNLLDTGAIVIFKTREGNLGKFKVVDQPKLRSAHKVNLYNLPITFVLYDGFEGFVLEIKNWKNENAKLPEKLKKLSVLDDFKEVSRFYGGRQNRIAIHDSLAPEYISYEPYYDDRNQQYYGLIDVGSPYGPIPFCLDVSENGKALMYVDKNRNGDLNDDGKPMSDQGTRKSGDKGFATQINIPWEFIHEGLVNRKGSYAIWFFINNKMWGNKPASAGFYNRFHLKATVDLDGEIYDIYLAGNKLTDGTFAIDLDQSGKIDSFEFRVKNYDINGVKYTFDIDW